VLVPVDAHLTDLSNYVASCYYASLNMVKLYLNFFHCGFQAYPFVPTFLRKGTYFPQHNSLRSEGYILLVCWVQHFAVDRVGSIEITSM